tara:strand:+ start:1116 stop:1733 length:618 start_codon:yes stop_codon:yes gene_type:complete
MESKLVRGTAIKVTSDIPRWAAPINPPLKGDRLYVVKKNRGWLRIKNRRDNTFTNIRNGAWLSKDIPANVSQSVNTVFEPSSDNSVSHRPNISSTSSYIHAPSMDLLIRKNQVMELEAAIVKMKEQNHSLDLIRQNQVMELEAAIAKLEEKNRSLLMMLDCTINMISTADDVLESVALRDLDPQHRRLLERVVQLRRLRREGLDS